MKKISKIMISMFIVFILCAFIFGVIDRNRTLNNKEPIFCIDQSGGSIIFYVGPGYVIEGAWDDHPGGLEHTQIHTWLYFLIECIKNS